MTQVISLKSSKTGPIVICYHIKLIVREFNWTHKDCPRMMTIGYNGLKSLTAVNVTYNIFSKNYS